MLGLFRGLRSGFGIGSVFVDQRRSDLYRLALRAPLRLLVTQFVRVLASRIITGGFGRRVAILGLC